MTAITSKTLLKLHKAGGTLDLPGLLGTCVGLDLEAERILDAARALSIAQRTYDRAISAAEEAVAHRAFEQWLDSGKVPA